MHIYSPPEEISTLIKDWISLNSDFLETTNYKNFSIGCNFWKGKNHTDSTKKLLSSLNSGENNPMFGKKLTTEQKLKISQKQIGRPLSKEHKLAISKSKTGIPRSEETKRKISEARKKSKQLL